MTTEMQKMLSMNLTTAESSVTEELLSRLQRLLQEGVETAGIEAEIRDLAPVREVASSAARKAIGKYSTHCKGDRDHIKG